MNMDASCYVNTLAQGYVNQWKNLDAQNKRHFIRGLRRHTGRGLERLARLRALMIIEG